MRHVPKSDSAVQAAFGPFMRIEQLIISTVPSASSGALPPIVTDDNIKLLFDIQEQVDNLTVTIKVPYFLAYACAPLSNVATARMEIA